jgi:hypothetical protein
MFKKLLMAIGLRKAPPPVRSYLAASSFVGFLPALAFVAWKYRDRIGPAVRRLRGREEVSAQAI